MRDAAMPLFEAALGEAHPELMWTSGNVGVCLLVCQQAQGLGLGLEAGAGAGDETEAGAGAGAGGSDGQGQGQGQGQAVPSSMGAETLVKSALDFLATYSHGPFPADHPWVLRLGGYGQAQAQVRAQELEMELAAATSAAGSGSGSVTGSGALARVRPALLEGLDAWVGLN